MSSRGNIGLSTSQLFHDGFSLRSKLRGRSRDRIGMLIVLVVHQRGQDIDRLQIDPVSRLRTTLPTGRFLQSDLKTRESRLQVDYITTKALPVSLFS